MLMWSVVGRGPSMVEAQWSTVVAGAFVAVDGQGSTLDAWRPLKRKAWMASVHGARSIDLISRD